jgi:hypothetical protein
MVTYIGFRSAIVVMTLLALLSGASTVLSNDNRIICRSVKITTPAVSLQLACGQSAQVDVVVRYAKWGKAASSGNLCVTLWENDSFLRRDDQLSDAACQEIRASDPVEGAKQFSFTVTCDPQVSRKCVFHGPNGSDDDTNSDHEIFVTVEGCGESNVVTARCLKPDGSMGCVENPGTAGGTVATVASLSDNPTLVTSIDVSMTYDTSVLGVPAVTPTPEYLAGFDSPSVDASIPGRIRFLGHASSPRFTNGPLANIVFPISPSAAFGETFVHFDPSLSSLHGPGGMLMDTQMARVPLKINPPDSGPPVLDAARIHVTSSGISGHSGSVFDDNGAIPGWVEVSLSAWVDTEYLPMAGGRAVVNPDGSFFMPLLLGIDPAQFRLTAVDAVHGETHYDFNESIIVAETPDEAPVAGDALEVAPLRGAAGSFEIRYRISGREQVSLDVYDLRGRRVRSLDHGVREGGWHRQTWAGGGDGGARLAQGIYWIRLVAGDRKISKPVSLVR